ncbi:Delta-aminolevulinic acid dehydratase [Brevundimonas diminuta]|jgi:porphobilinogen synthase|uniref:porphobilinogen synthase n=1 Tax=Brevundimonas diminuta TaxID=293 RepID=UPI000207F413|nr:porphobilinogen synthase [Brevundimonas diminuta]EGF94927.1 delta-aminolevulinic acid dehydratase [Brevundimonas diminuta ATCC 11568]OWR24437.1 porphobilinogen synthase [Brevundimonas diminuta]WQE46290.1 porphobilinogen synthase [Brevundimonas diminuta]SPU48255.1 Delta-aminolevulinic acid dehydratase [Brevundimonas diminuta]SUW15540.1 Delta-aminolevulinic acid dehydratase [Brevundimonas diminuta]
MTMPFQPAAFPYARPRRLRSQPWVRRLVAETTLTPADLIWPLIVHDGDEDRQPVASMPGVFRLSPKEAAKAAVEARDLGIPMVALFPNVNDGLKDNVGAAATDPDGLIPDCIRAIKDAAPEIGVMTDVALDCYTDHGHDGVLEDGRIVNDPTLERLAEQAFIHAHAGADAVAPSDMMDGRVQAIREALEANGLSDTLIISYAAKYASAFYGPYRDAVGSSKSLTGDKKTYQMDFANAEEALREVAMDLSEGADALIVKPGLPYLDIVRLVSQTFKVPTFAYQVSGEYAMMQAAFANGWLDPDRAILESLHAFKRAGASGVISYFAPQAARMMG